MKLAPPVRRSIEADLERTPLRLLPSGVPRGHIGQTIAAFSGYFLGSALTSIVAGSEWLPVAIRVAASILLFALSQYLRVERLWPSVASGIGFALVVAGVLGLFRDISVVVAVVELGVGAALFLGSMAVLAIRGEEAPPQ